ncbi:Myb protein [Thalictrum thalictroides]|uniref:Myb protein n=1 Tax=Thalictrum thalictroides TaxID=46969 RepID=A0A7J6VV45_THATH|nr:Myb protein [Thalictrum thalictroides]
MAIPTPPPNGKPVSKFHSEEDEFDDDEEEEDSLFNQDMEALKRACRLTGTNPNEIEDFNTTVSISDSESSEVDDVELVRRIQQSINNNNNSTPVSLKPLKSLPPVGFSDISDDDEDDDEDLQTLRTIERRFANYVPSEYNPFTWLGDPTFRWIQEDPDGLLIYKHSLVNCFGYAKELTCFLSCGPYNRAFPGFVETNTTTISNESEVVQGTSRTLQQENSHSLSIYRKGTNILGEDFSISDEAFNNSLPLVSINDTDAWNEPLDSNDWHLPEDSESPALSSKFSVFPYPKHAQFFIDAIKKNRLFQKLIRNKLIHIEAKIEENKKLKERIKILMDFQLSCKRRAGKALSQKKEARIQLISACKPRKSSVSKVNDKKVPALYLGPVENSHVDNYRMVMQRFPRSLRRERWSDAEKENLGEGIKQQFQEMLFQKSLGPCSDQMVSSGDSNTFNDIMTSIRDFDISPESIRTFLPKVDWERLASLYAVGRSGAECEARWLNHEDPLINHNPWTKVEDKNLLFIVQQRGIYNWIDISKKMKTNRTPFQCFARYQRSLNACIMKRDWLEEDDAQLRSAVEAFGENNWQLVASYVEGRTNTQCSNRWMKTINPARERVGRWTVEEDKHLKVAVVLFGSKTWNKIAKFVPGRTQAQCRERWVNVLDPALNLARWTEEEDSRLKAAIAEHGYYWRKVAEAVPPRTDNQCRRRWKVLLPHEVPMLQAARRVEKLALISNFVDRAAERPELGPSDFLPLPGPSDITEHGNNIRKEKKSRRTARSKKQKDTSSGNNGVSKRKNAWKQPKNSGCPEPTVRSEEISSSDQNLSKENVGDDDEKTVPKENVARKKKKAPKPCLKEKCTKSKQCGQELALSIEASGGLKNGSTTEDNITSKKKRKRKPCSDNKKCKEREPCDHQESQSPQLSAIMERIGSEHEILTEDNATLKSKVRKIRAKRKKYSQQDKSDKSKVAGISQAQKGLEIIDEDDELGDNESLASFLHNKVKRKAQKLADKPIMPPARKRKVATEMLSASETSMLLAEDHEIPKLGLLPDFQSTKSDNTSLSEMLRTVCVPETVDDDNVLLTTLMQNKVKRISLEPAGKEGHAVSTVGKRKKATKLLAERENSVILAKDQEKLKLGENLKFTESKNSSFTHISPPDRPLESRRKGLSASEVFSQTIFRDDIPLASVLNKKVPLKSRSKGESPE